ncbi:hypothetical protein FDH02_gp42 [Pseudomonas phage VSW-3]|uniref:Uncharacterized protein n=1 Tax=Pseudomonas phage VSW-3 TaxID=1852562 RepID=A0A173GD96_9CAUD|nr:hypothetical protein FDH02_gp42 [Pseudomonas phage VSW-3]ANH51118.1 hypothetical protein VSW3_43 [Pseudomonas phage VSW-3]
MPQVILKVPMEQYYYALNHNARRRPEIRMGCTPAEELCIITSKEFHRRNPQTLAVTMSTTRKDWQKRVANFYDKVCHVRVAAEGNDKRGGFVVMDGELLTLHSIDKGNGDWLMREALSLGANRLDTFDIPYLIEFYQKHGFREILREKNTKKGMPDIVWMRKD